MGGGEGISVTEAKVPEEKDGLRQLDLRWVSGRAARICNHLLRGSIRAAGKLQNKPENGSCRQQRMPFLRPAGAQRPEAAAGGRGRSKRPSELQITRESPAVAEQWLQLTDLFGSPNGLPLGSWGPRK